jgi:hypothetical protein
VLNYGNVEIKIVDIYFNDLRTSYYQGGGDLIPTTNITRIVFPPPPPLPLTNGTYQIVLISERGVPSVFSWEK